MPLKINYLTSSDKNKFIVGKIVIYNNYKIPSIDFPYFYLGYKPEILTYSSWPELVPYLYDKKIGYFTTINNVYQFKDNFIINSFFINNNILTLNFLDQHSLKILSALIEDRELHRFENGSYANWYKTITPTSSVISNNKIILEQNKNYKIENIFKLTDNLIRIEIKLNNIENISSQNLNSKSIEIGPYRMEGKTEKDQIYYSGIDGKYFCTPNSTEFVGGLKNRSQLISHFHNHKHDMNNHTHKITHTHTLSAHTHGMTHSHLYPENYSGVGSYGFGPVLIRAGYGDLYWGSWVNVLGSQTNTNKETLYSRDWTDLPNILDTGLASEFATSPSVNSLTNNNSSLNKTNTTEKNVLFTNDDNFKIGNKNQYDSNIVYTYLYAGKYIPGN